MRKKALAIISMIFGIMLIVTATAGCAPTGGQTSTQQPSTGSTDTGKTETPTTTAKPVELRVEVFDRGTPGQTPVDNNYWTKWIQENFGDPNNIKVTFVPCPRSQEVDTLNVWMATGDAPDICLTYDVATVYNYYKEGGLSDLTDALNQYGAQLKQYLGD
ncbi:MAG: ABC transporter substrate-binding protein, partial [Clostridiaceae bacterium]|nr:ABC transporter substrate-binding protein [Clostridiaceae bacterium]